MGRTGRLTPGETDTPFLIGLTGNIATGKSEVARMLADLGAQVIDASGRVLVPGFVDGHTHIASLYTVNAFVEHAARGGTTTIITETLEPYPVAGIDVVLDFLASLKDQPMRFFATAPAMVI